MGSVFCCLRVDGEEYEPVDVEEHELQNSPGCGHFICFRYLTHPFINAYTMLVQRRQEHTSPSSVQGTATLDFPPVEDNSISDTYRSPPRPLPYDDPRCSRLQYQHDGLVSRRRKASSHFHEESQPLRSSGIHTDKELMSTAKKFDASECEGGPKLYQPESSLNPGVTYFFSLSEDEDEDVCPTCLEEYTSENPRITLRCSHDFHLGCIYEWMERSEACPVCGKVMVFEET